MGWDITYHPVGADEISSIYFTGLADHEYYKSRPPPAPELKR